MGAFDEDTAVRPVGEGRWAARIDAAWNIGDNPNGGYLVAVVLRALQSLGPHPDPVSVTTHFLRPGTGSEDAMVEGELVRTGRSVTTVRGRLHQEGSQRIEVLAAFADLDAGSPVDAALTIPAPPMPPPEECLTRSGAEQGVELPILGRLETLIHPEQVLGGQAGRAEISGWIRFADGQAPDPLAAVLCCDAFPPSLFGLLGVIGWVPTIELTVHVRRRPAPGWLLGRFTTRDVRQGRMVEDGALWDEQGALVAQSRQLGLLLTR